MAEEILELSGLDKKLTKKINKEIFSTEPATDNHLNNFYVPANQIFQTGLLISEPGD